METPTIYIESDVFLITDDRGRPLKRSAKLYVYTTDFSVCRVFIRGDRRPGDHELRNDYDTDFHEDLGLAAGVHIQVFSPLVPEFDEMLNLGSIEGVMTPRGLALTSVCSGVNVVAKDTVHNYIRQFPLDI